MNIDRKTAKQANGILPILGTLDTLEHQINKFNRFFICLDYDGTLTPIISHPDEAVLSGNMKTILDDISNIGNTYVTIVTGRSYTDIRQRVMLDNIYYAANHGFEIHGPDISRTFTDSQWQMKLQEMCSVLNTNLNRYKGVWIEPKGLTASVHFRQADENELDNIEESFFEVLKNYENYFISKGKKVFEIRNTSEWNKGKAVSFLGRYLFGDAWEKTVFTMYIGDDTTDEDAFRLIKKFGTGIKVTGKEFNNTHARYFLRTVSQVEDFLSWFLKNLRTVQ